MSQQNATTTKKQTKESVKKAIARTAQGWPLLGHLLWWSFSEMVLGYEQFKAMLVECGIDPEFANPIRKKSAITHALDAFVKDEGKAKFKRKPADTAEATVWVIVHQAMNVSSQDVTFTTETKVVFNKKDQTHHVIGAPEVKEKLNELIELYEKSYTTDQIRSTITGYLYEGCQGVMVRETGGVYFCPSTQQAEFDKLKKLFQKIAELGFCAIDTTAVVDEPESAASMWRALTTEARADMEEMRKDLEDLKANPSQRAQETRLEKYLALKTKIQMFETLLNGTASELMTELNKIETNFRERLLAGDSK